MKIIIQNIFAGILAISVCGSILTVRGQHNPYFKSNRSVIVHLFEWKFNDVANECEKFLGPRGYAGVQLSPVNENLIIRVENVTRPWWERYQPMSYKILTRSGNEEEFLNMTKRCNKAGVRIYADVMLNHMAKPVETMIGTAGSLANGSELSYPAVPYDANDFHNPCPILSYFNAYEIRNCKLCDLPDLDQSSEKVRGKLIDYLNHLISLGVAGFRIDAAKHMWPNDIQIIYSQLQNLSVDFDFPENARPFIFLEVIDLGAEAISKTEYNNIGVVTEFLYSAEIGNIFRGKAPLSTLINWGPTLGFLPSQDSLVFVDNHDNQRGHGSGGDMILTFKLPRLYKAAIAFMLAHPFGITRIMSSYNFTSSDEGPPMDDDENIISPSFEENDNENGQCTDESGWICEHRWPSIRNMVEFRNVVENERIINWQDNGANQIAFCRGDKGFIAFNNAPGEDFTAEIQVCLEPGSYCDVISGEKGIEGCTGLTIVVNKNRTAEITIPYDGEDSVVAIHVLSRID